MKVSVVIPVYNEADVIEECLESLRRQSYKNLEIIVVDDGSSDATLQKLKASKTPKLQVLAQPHLGAGAARNFGASKAKGEILVFVDADMTFAPDFIRNLVKPIEEGKAIGTFSKEEYLANKDNIWAVCWNLNRGLPKDRMHPQNYSDHQPVFRAILKTEFERAGGFNEKAGYTDDWTLSEKLGVKAVAAPGAVFYHKNPASLREVFSQSKWMAKRRYKWGVIGYILALARVSFPASLFIGFIKSIAIFNLRFLIFKIVSDFGQFIGILEYLKGKVTK